MAQREGNHQDHCDLWWSHHRCRYRVLRRGCNPIRPDWTGRSCGPGLLVGRRARSRGCASAPSSSTACWRNGIDCDIASRCAPDNDVDVLPPRLDSGGGDAGHHAAFRRRRPIRRAMDKVERNRRVGHHNQHRINAVGDDRPQLPRPPAELFARANHPSTDGYRRYRLLLEHPLPEVRSRIPARRKRSHRRDHDQQCTGDACNRRTHHCPFRVCPVRPAGVGSPTHSRA